MADREHLHDAEVLLCSMRPTPALLVSAWLKGVYRALLVAVPLAGSIGIGWWAFAGRFPHWACFILLYLLCLAAFWRIAWTQWRTSVFRVTTDRILLEYPKGLTKHAHRTIKWPQYQESSTGSGGFLSLFWKGKALELRYGSPDGEITAHFPPLRHAGDLKQYLDKADSMIRKNQIAELRPFVAKPRGQRD